MRMGKIIRERYPELDGEDQEAVRQHAIAALNLTQQGAKIVTDGYDGNKPTANTALIDGVPFGLILWLHCPILQRRTRDAEWSDTGDGAGR